MTEVFFPLELLNKSIEERQEYFVSKTISHDLLDNARKELVNLIDEPGSGGLILVVGPTGVGKSTLLRLTHNSILKRGRSPDTIPSISLELVAPDKGSFKFKDFYIRALQELHEPFIDKKILPPGLSDTTDRSPERYRRSLENALHYRKTRTFFIDEAQHFGMAATGQKFETQTDSLKSLANMSKTLLVLFGHYSLLTLRGESGQLLRRAPKIHLPRYDLRVDGHQLKFKEALKGLQVQLPVESQESLMPHWDFFYERSAGCVGILKDWFRLALWDTLNAEENTVSIDKFKRHCLTLEECKTLAKEINDGELDIAKIEMENEEKRTTLWTFYGVDPTKLKTEMPKKTRKKAQPGVQKPNRKPSGGGLSTTST